MPKGPRGEKRPADVIGAGDDDAVGEHAGREDGEAANARQREAERHGRWLREPLRD